MSGCLQLRNVGGQGREVSVDKKGWQEGDFGGT